MFRPARRVSWGTRIFALLVFLVAVGAIGAFLEVLLPQQVAKLAEMEGNELVLARKGTADVNTAVAGLWAELSPKGSMGLTAARMSEDLALAKRTERSADEALSHVQAAQAYMAQADGLPFQFHAPTFIAPDRAAAQHLEKALTTSIKLSHAATLQLTLAEHMSQNSQSLVSMNASLNARDWTNAARTASTIATDLKSQQSPAGDPEALLDPLWAKWVDAMLGVAISAQQYSLASAANQTQQAQQAGRTLAAARDQLAATFAAAQNGAAAWQAKTVQPILDSVARETASGA
ncbi:MAG: hypothetical protein E6H98_03275 [Chloroflexi bacterium]|nr:MAG: hypothetical protein E6I46_09610 [Chloroflexota bacterium]TMG19090.1 MAG: hypothetical protein E6H98_03275 [Chloroflexota bacterium]